MMKGLLTSCVIILIIGCGNKDGIPSDVLPQKKMQAVLWDMMRADQFLSDYVLNKDTSLKQNVESIKLYQQILAIHAISKEKFERSFDFYQAHQLLLRAIMDSIVNAPPEIIIADTSKVLTKGDSTKTNLKDSLAAAIKADSIRVKAKKDSILAVKATDSLKVLKKLKKKKGKLKPAN